MFATCFFSAYKRERKNKHLHSVYNQTYRYKTVHKSTTPTTKSPNSRDMSEEQQTTGTEESRTPQTEEQQWNTNNSVQEAFREIKGGFQFESDNCRYWLVKRIGNGGYGRVFEADAQAKDGKPQQQQDPRTNKNSSDNNNSQKVAIKIEPRRTTENIEARMLQTAKEKKCRHFPVLFDQGTLTHRQQRFTFITMERMGRDLYQLRKERKDSRFSVGTAVRVGIEALKALRELHDECGYISRDIKPGNFVTGPTTTDDVRSVYMIDFGLCRRYRDANNNLLPSRGEVGWRGTYIYGSLRAHKRMDLGRRDDVESWFYMLVELTRGPLPWDALRDRDEIGKRKHNARQDDNFLAGCPAEFKDLMTDIDGLQFSDTPAYTRMIGTLELILQRRGIDRRGPMDWENDALDGTDEDGTGWTDTESSKWTDTEGNKWTDMESSKWTDTEGNKWTNSEGDEGTNSDHTHSSRLSLSYSSCCII